MKPSAIVGAMALWGLVSVGSAESATMTFTGLGPLGSEWTEDGITATSSDGYIAPYQNPDTAHMDPRGWTSWASTITFTMGGYFNAVGIDILDIEGTWVCEEDGDGELICGLPYDNVRLAGFRDGNLIAEDIFFTGDLHSPHYAFSAGFTMLDSLTISLLYPNFGFCLSECSHFDIDNVTLSPVPLPGALPLFLLGLTGLGLLRWARK